MIPVLDKQQYRELAYYLPSEILVLPGRIYRGSHAATSESGRMFLFSFFDAIPRETSVLDLSRQTVFPVLKLCCIGMLPWSAGIHKKEYQYQQVS